MSNHTPGPWHVTGTPSAYGREHVVSDDGLCIATVHQPDPHPGRRAPREVLLANSNIIAAAPDLLAELERLHEAARVMCDPEHCFHETREYLPWEELAAKSKAAIDKARGRIT